MPGWYRKYEDDLEDRGARIVGLIQEQHPERCRLFLQWQQMDFPVLVDSLNRIGVHAVPLMWAIDEHGVVQKTRPDETWIRETFLATDYPEPEAEPAAEKAGAGVAAFLDGDWTAAIEAFAEQVEADPGDAESWFRLGCAYRARHDSEARRRGDFQAAVGAWTEAVDRNPGNYIFRRRLQQYGPRLMKPYPFYDWVARARNDIAARGEDPVALLAEPEGAEIAQPQRRGGALAEAAAGQETEPDSGGEIPRDDADLVVFEGAVAPQPVTAGETARVYLRFDPDDDKRVTWDNEAGTLKAWVVLPEGMEASRRLLAAELPPRPSSSETRTLELEVRIPEDAEGILELEGYALYFVCEGEEGACVFLRRDFTLPVQARAAK